MSSHIRSHYKTVHHAIPNSVNILTHLTTKQIALLIQDSAPLELHRIYPLNTTQHNTTLTTKHFLF